MSWYAVIAAACVSFSITFFLIPFLRIIAFKTGTLDIPNGDLKKHEKPTPYLGGVGIFLGCAISAFYFLSSGTIPPFFYGGLSVLLLVGLIDDLYAITPLRKFLGQILACLCFLKAGLFFNEEIFSVILPSFLQIPCFISLLNIFLSSWWMLTVINAFNLVDVMDGLSSTIAYVASLSFIGIAILFNNDEIALLLAVLLGSLGAFFYYNKPPRALIYLGDAGSLFIGGCLATTPFFLRWGNSSKGTLVIPVFILAIPLIELCSLMVIRKYKNIPFYHGSPHHFICYLKARRWSVSKIVLFTGVAASCFGGYAFLIAFKNVAFLPAVSIGLFLVFVWVLAIFFGRSWVKIF